MVARCSRDGACEDRTHGRGEGRDRTGDRARPDAARDLHGRGNGRRARGRAGKLSTGCAGSRRGYCPDIYPLAAEFARFESNPDSARSSPRRECGGQVEGGGHRHYLDVDVDADGNVNPQWVILNKENDDVAV